MKAETNDITKLVVENHDRGFFSDPLINLTGEDLMLFSKSHGLISEVPFNSSRTAIYGGFLVAVGAWLLNFVTVN